jgi:hypothetical protein
MNKLFVVVAALLLLLFQSAYGQDDIPVLKGTVNISVAKGTIECNLILSNVPRINDYVIRINSGMNMRYFRSVDKGFLIGYDKSFTDTLSTGESSAYYFSDNTGKGKFLPKAIQFRYVGMYPVILDTIKEYSRNDWKGNLAFNGYSVRADGNQSCWYPVLYDIKKDKAISKLKYDLEINCPDCNTLYVNGCLPVKGPKAHFKSDAPLEISMFCGNYRTANIDGTYILNPDMNEGQIKMFGAVTNSYKKYYEDKLLVPYKKAITYIQTTPTSKDNAWLFVSYPSIFNIGYGKYGLKQFLDQNDGDWFKPYVAHELGHYYFGFYKSFNSELGDMMSEGFSEYLSLKITQELISDSIYRKKISEKINDLGHVQTVSFARVKSANDYNNRDLYVYNYAPIIFLAIEKEIGQQNMWKWLNRILETQTAFTNYAFLEQTLDTVLQDSNKLAQIESKYFDSEKSLENAIATIGQK